VPSAKPKDASSKDRSPPTGKTPSPNSHSSTPTESTPTSNPTYTENSTSSALALGLHPATAGHRVETARTLVHGLPATLALLTAGQISLAHARVVTEHLHGLTAEQADRVQAQVLPLAGGLTPGQLGQRLAKLVLRIAPEQAEIAHAAAVADRDVRYRPGPDGTGRLTITGAAQDCQAAFQGLLATAARDRATAGETRTRAQLRADTATGLLGALLDDSGLPRTRGVRPAVRITLSLATLLGDSQAPGRLDGHGFVHAEQARRIAARRQAFSRLIWSPLDGRPLDVTPERRFPLTDLDRHVIARDQTCQLPVCDRPATTCDLDHTVPWSAGGSTTATNLASP